MAAGTAYDPRLDLVAWTPDGRPAAAATGWLAGPGRVGLLEPVGTHADHRRQGYGHRVTVAVMAALARAGARGVRVHTPAGNTAAVAAYQRCGMRPIDLTTDVVRSGA
jgi:ribosomal protein S18 acetylase RimI-like enzyme